MIKKMNKKNVAITIICIALVMLSVSYILLTQVFGFGLNLKKVQAETTAHQRSFVFEENKKYQEDYQEKSELRYTDLVSDSVENENSLRTRVKFEPGYSITGFTLAEQNKRIKSAEIILKVTSSTAYNLKEYYKSLSLKVGSCSLNANNDLTELLEDGSYKFYLTASNPNIGKGDMSLTYTLSCWDSYITLECKGIQLTYANAFITESNKHDTISRVATTVDSVSGNILINIPKATPFGNVENYVYPFDYRTNLEKIGETETDYIFETTKEDFATKYFCYDYTLQEKALPRIEYRVESFGIKTSELVCVHDEVSDTCYYILDLETPTGYTFNRISSNLILEKISDTRYKITCENTTTGGFVHVKYVLKSSVDVDPEPDEQKPSAEQDKLSGWEQFETWQQVLIIAGGVLAVLIILAIIKKLLS